MSRDVATLWWTCMAVTLVADARRAHYALPKDGRVDGVCRHRRTRGPSQRYGARHESQCGYDFDTSGGKVNRAGFELDLHTLRKEADGMILADQCNEFDQLIVLELLAQPIPQLIFHRRSIV